MNGVWTCAINHAATLDESILEEEDPIEVYARGADWGARWMIAIIQMAEAIQYTDTIRRIERVVGPLDDESGEGPSSPWPISGLDQSIFDEFTADWAPLPGEEE